MSVSVTLSKLFYIVSVSVTLSKTYYIVSVKVSVIQGVVVYMELMSRFIQRKR